MIRIIATTPYVIASVGAVSKSIPAIARPIISAAMEPITTPLAASTHDSVSTDRATRAGDAPSARRMPSSLVRSATVCATTPYNPIDASNSASAANDPALVRPIAVLFVVANLAHIAMLVRYFAFPLPMVFDALIALALAGAAIAS